MQVPERKLHRYLSAISERADVRVGSPLPLGTQETCGGVNFSIFSRYASRVQLELFDHPEDAKATRIIELDPARTALETSGTPGWQESLSVSSMRTAWTALMSPVKAIVSISTDSCLIRSRQRFRGYLVWDFASARGYDPSAPGKDLTPSTRDNSASMPKCVLIDQPSIGKRIDRFGTLGRRPSSTRRMFGASRFIRAPAWIIREPTGASWKSFLISRTSESPPWS